MTFTDYHLGNKIPSETFQEFYNLLETSFPKFERRTKEKQQDILENKHYHILEISENEKFIGFITFWDFDNFIYYEHFATSPDCRNNGIGSATLSYLNEKHAKPCFLEIELPDDELTTRRQKFYEKNGYTTHNFTYYQPPYHTGDIYSQMWIMSKNVSIDETSFNKYKEVIYNNAYGVDL